MLDFMLLGIGVFLMGFGILLFRLSFKVKELDKEYGKRWRD